MALITHRCSARGATAIFTIDDVTNRVTQVSWIAVANVLRILIFDEVGSVALEINTGVDVSPIAVDLPARLVEIVKPDTSIKSYICPNFAVFW